MVRNEKECVLILRWNAAETIEERYNLKVNQYVHMYSM